MPIDDEDKAGSRSDVWHFLVSFAGAVLATGVARPGNEGGISSERRSLWQELMKKVKNDDEG